ncbi:N-acetylmuramoyl-L-alanine amidase [Arthrobacter sp. SLBN-53]|uniref:N-acetylmuramoyl-L-alanine amidase n=1 Tax=Arthrobacter sp. SLBN-53 TaxID=2768412 RepID=UPI0011533D14|nr:N-acetylmuramoyl-L-alanine amidase [Arthrobacter sp. SLBN-53]TQK29362.1 putative peptidoglycan binding protein [Arthrobacter sp. SLBN-53]
MVDRFWPLGAGRIITSPFGPREYGFHAGTDFGREGGSAGMPVYAVQAGTVIFAGAAGGYGGPDPAGWLVIDSTDAEGGGCLEYGHIIREVARGDHVTAGQRIGRINPDRRTNADVAPHLHLSDMPRGYHPAAKQNPLTRLTGAREPEPALSVTPKSDQSQETPMGWTGDPIWLADVVRPAVSKFVEYPGWKTRGHGDFKDIRGIMVHHTGGRASAASIANGRPDLPGPLSQFHIARDGTITLICVGVAWHAGMGSYTWLPTNMGNWHLIGIECEGPVTPGIGPGNQHIERWPDVQVIALRNLCAAILLKLRFGSDRLIGHKDYAGRAQGKWDPWNMDVTGWLAGEVDKDMRGFVFPGEDGPRPVPPVTPAPVPAPTPPIDKYAGVLLYRGINAPAKVRALQTRLKFKPGTNEPGLYSKIVVDGDYGAHTEACVRDYQKNRPPLIADGVVGPATAARLGLVL